jgi:hypothetical protein
VDSSRLRTGEIVAGGGGIALFVFLFFDWFSGGAELTGTVGNLSVSNVGISGWNALTDLPGFLIMLSGVSGIALACLAAAGQRVNIPVRRGGVTAMLGSLAILLILWRMVAGSPTLKIGIFLGLAAAVAITAGGLMALAEDGFQPFVAVASASTTTVAAASAPPATPSPPRSVAGSAPKTRSSGGSRSGGSTTRKTRKTRSSTKRSTTKKSSGGKRSSSKKSSSRSGTAKRSASTRARSTTKSTTAKRAKSSHATASKKSSSSRKSSSAKPRSSGGKRSSGSRKK